MGAVFSQKDSEINSLEGHAGIAFACLIPWLQAADHGGPASSPTAAEAIDAEAEGLLLYLTQTDIKPIFLRALKLPAGGAPLV
jgi:hypothetical protein